MISIEIKLDEHLEEEYLKLFESLEWQGILNETFERLYWEREIEDTFWFREEKCVK